MEPNKTILFWKGRASASLGEDTPPHPSGPIDLSGAEMDGVSGGLPRLTLFDACPILSISGCSDSVTWFSC